MVHTISKHLKRWNFSCNLHYTDLRTGLSLVMWGRKIFRKILMVFSQKNFLYFPELQLSYIQFLPKQVFQLHCSCSQITDLIMNLAKIISLFVCCLCQWATVNFTCLKSQRKTKLTMRIWLMSHTDSGDWLRSRNRQYAYRLLLALYSVDERLLGCYESELLIAH